VAFTDVFNDTDEGFRIEFRVEKGGASSFAEFPATRLAFEEPSLAWSVSFSEFQVSKTRFAVVFALGEGAG
jgi:hypothetical protein